MLSIINKSIESNKRVLVPFHEFGSKDLDSVFHFGLCQFDFIEGAFFFLAYTKADMKALS